jgi:cytoskeletal protein CcmA (bactofilin family)
MLRAARRDDGVAMAAVLGLLAVGIILTSVILVSVVGATNYSTYTRAGVQAQAAAEAGIAAARAGLATGTCSEAGGAPVYHNAANQTPVYAAAIYRPAAGGGWVAGCPVGTSTQVRILSTGYAVEPGTNGVSANNTVVLEAILAAASTPTTITASGPAIYAYASSSFGGGARFVSVDGSSPDVLVRTGNVTCSGSFPGLANFVVKGGTLAIDGSCAIEGNAFATGRMTLTGSGYVRGFAVANGVQLEGSSRIYGRVWSSSDIVLSGNPTVSGILKAQSAVLDGGTVSSQAYIYGNTNVKNAGGTTLKATFTTQTANPTPPSWWGGNARITKVNPITAPTYASDVPAMPIVPDWIDFGARSDEYTSTVWTGFTVYTMGATCDADALRTALTAIGSSPGLIDGRLCSNGIVLGGSNQFTIVNDLAIMVPKFTMDGSASFTSATSHRMWIINPDRNANATPVGDCPGGLSITGGATFSSKIDLLLYSPCTITIASSTSIRGQIFSGDVTLGGSGQVSYVAIGLPGVNLSTGVRESNSSTSADRALVSLRNVSG